MPIPAGTSPRPKEGWQYCVALRKLVRLFVSSFVSLLVWLVGLFVSLFLCVFVCFFVCLSVCLLVGLSFRILPAANSRGPPSGRRQVLSIGKHSGHIPEDGNEQSIHWMAIESSMNPSADLTQFMS